MVKELASKPAFYQAEEVNLDQIQNFLIWPKARRDINRASAVFCVALLHKAAEKSESWHENMAKFNNIVSFKSVLKTMIMIVFIFFVFFFKFLVF